MSTHTLRQNLWWLLVILALGAAFLFGSPRHLADPSRHYGKPAPGGLRAGPAPPFAY